MTSTKTSAWVGDGANALVAKSVVSGTGHAIGKNYKHAELRDGDIGLMVRIDRGKVPEKGMTPEQRLAAQTVGHELTEMFLDALGVEQELGFAPGMVVSAQDEHEQFFGLIAQMSETSATLKRVNDVGEIVLVRIPLAVYTLEEVLERHGIAGLVLAYMTGSHTGVFEELLAHVPEEELPFLVMYADRRENAMAALERMQDSTKLPEILRKVRDCFVQETCVKKITDPDVLVELLTSGGESWDANAPHMKIFDGLLKCNASEEHFKRLAQEGMHYEVRKRAVKNIQDTAFLREMLLDEHESCARAAYDKLSDEELDLMDVVRRMGSWRFRDELLKKLSREQLIELTCEEDVHLARAALNAIRELPGQLMKGQILRIAREAHCVTFVSDLVLHHCESRVDVRIAIACLTKARIGAANVREQALRLVHWVDRVRIVRDESLPEDVRLQALRSISFSDTDGVASVVSMARQRKDTWLREQARVRCDEKGVSYRRRRATAK